HDRGALKLMQRIRDEAHRFANRYNELLLRKRVKESLLDDCPGISPAKKKALLRRFGSVARIKEARVDQIAGMSGFSVKSAEGILAWLKRD
ncbi:MAG: helix-hairpin-helix domain-containing protein, partial [Akkermansiaceae bacterium]